MATLRELSEKLEHLIKSIYDLTPEGDGDGFLLQRGRVVQEAEGIKKNLDETIDLDEWTAWFAKLTFELGLPMNTSRGVVLERLRRRGRAPSLHTSDGIRELWAGGR